MSPLMNLPKEMLEEIFRRMTPQDSASMSQTHPFFRQLYRQRITADLKAAKSWEDFAAVVDGVLNHQAGSRIKRLSIKLQEKYPVNQTSFDTAVGRWLEIAHRHRVSVLELHGNINTCIQFNFITWKDIRDLQLEWVHLSKLQLVLQLLMSSPLKNLQRLNLKYVTIDSHTNLGLLLEACPNLKVFILESCFGIGALNINCALLETLDICGVFDWTVNIINLPVLTHFDVCSKDLPQFCLLQNPISMAPILPQHAVANVQDLFITVDDNLPIVIRFIQYLHHSLRYLHLSWFVSTNMEYQVDNIHKLEELDIIAIGGAPSYDEPLRVMVEYVLAHSPNLKLFTLVVPTHWHAEVLEDDYLFEIRRSIMGLPRASQQVQFEFY